MSDPEHEFVDVLEAEQADFDALLASLTDDEWELATPAEGWSVRNQVSHLADTEEIASDTVTDGPRALAKEGARLEGGVIPFGVERGRTMAPAELLAWWRSAAAVNRAALRGADTSSRVPWGLGMGWRTFVTARTMEHWAHGLDVRAAVGRPGRDTERLQHIAWLGYSSLPYGFRRAEVEPPPGHTLRLALVGPGGERWELGPEDATDRIEGPAGVWCRRAVQRITFEEAAELDREGPLAELAVRHARAFL